MTQPDNTIGSEIDKLLEKYTGVKGLKTDYTEYLKIGVTNLIAQEANKARLETMQKVSDRLDDLHQGTEGAGWVHYGEMGEWLDDEISRLTAEKGSNNG